MADNIVDSNILVSDAEAAIAEVPKLKDQDAALWQNVNEAKNDIAAIKKDMAVSEVRDGLMRSGISMHCVSSGNLFSYFSGESTITEQITVAPFGTFLIADTEDFPEFGMYQGVPLVETGYAFNIDVGGFSNISVLVMIDGTGIQIANLSGEPLIIPENSVFTFNKMLILGTPPE